MGIFCLIVFHLAVETQYAYSYNAKCDGMSTMRVVKSELLLVL